MPFVPLLREGKKAGSFGKNYLLSRPFYVSFDVTNYCNLRCEGCDYPLLLANKSLGKDVPLGNLEERLERLNKTFGSMVMVLAGFEPTVRRDLAEIIRAASRNNYVGMVTNGTLITREAAQRFWEAGMLFASVSMPAFDDMRFREITGVKRYGIITVKKAVETLVETAPKFRKVAITATIDNRTTPEEMECIVAYAENVGALVSFQPYSAAKPASASTGYDTEKDVRKITMQTLGTFFSGSLAETVFRLKKRHRSVVGRKIALRNFDMFVREGRIQYKPRALKVYADGGIALHPEGQVFSSTERETEAIWGDYRNHVEHLRKSGGFYAENCYRCVNVTTPSTPLGDVVGMIWRGIGGR